MHRLIRNSIPACFLALSGCSLSGVVNRDIADYYDTASTANNRLLLLNILRARDRAPLHFSELSLVHGAVQATAGVTAAFPIGGSLLNAFRDTLTPTASVQASPTFDLGTLETQDFTKGIMTPVDPKVIKQFLDAGVDYRIVLILFFSDATLPPAPGGDAAMVLHNSMSCTTVDRRPDRPRSSCDRQFFDYLRFVNTIGRLEPYTFKAPPEPVGPPLVLKGNDALKAIASLNPSQYILKPGKNGYQVFAASSDQAVAFCTTNDPKVQTDASLQRFVDPTSPVRALTLVNADKAKPLQAGAAFDCSRRQPARFDPKLKESAVAATPTLTTRSVYGIIEYLGGLLDYQRRSAGGCISLGIPVPGEDCDHEDALFRLNPPKGKPAFAVDYMSTDYRVALPDGCQFRADSREPCDHTLEVLAVLSTLLNMNKVAKDIPATPSIQVVP